MIIAHFFMRKVKKKPHLFVETTSSDGIEQPAPAPQMLMSVTEGNRVKWVRDAYYEFIKQHPDLVLLDSMNNALRLKSEHPSFDLVFKLKPKRKSSKENISPEDILPKCLDDTGE